VKEPLQSVDNSCHSYCNNKWLSFFDGHTV